MNVNTYLASLSRMSSSAKSRCFVLRLCMTILLFLGLWLAALPPVHAQANPTARPSPTQVKADLDRILADPEFNPAPAGPASDNIVKRAVRWLGEKWAEFWDHVKKLFGGIPVIGGSAGLQWLFIGLFILLGAWFLSKLIRNYLTSSPGRKAKAPLSYTQEAFETEMVTEPDLWLQQAQRYAADGDYRRAFRAIFIALLLNLDRAGAIPYDRARTNGDYLRILRTKGLRALYEAFFPLSAEFDLRWYGNRPTAAEDYQRCKSEYERICGLIGTLRGNVAPASRAPLGGRG